MPILSYQGKKPKIADNAYISPRATVIGSATIGARCNVWEHAVIRADYNTIDIGTDTSIQDNSTVHCDVRYPTKIGSRVIVGHNAVVHGCTVEDNVLIGIGAAILNEAQVGQRSIIGAGSLIPPGKKIPPESVVVGVPGKVIRSITPVDRFELDNNWQIYVELGRRYKKELQEKTE
ncbi:MAG: gamma carbonic anhydrase family protein [Promethearchaeota archaeon]